MNATAEPIPTDDTLAELKARRNAARVLADRTKAALARGAAALETVQAEAERLNRELAHAEADTARALAESIAQGQPIAEVPDSPPDLLAARAAANSRVATATHAHALLAAQHSKATAELSAAEAELTMEIRRTFVDEVDVIAARISERTEANIADRIRILGLEQAVGRPFSFSAVAIRALHPRAPLEAPEYADALLGRGPHWSRIDAVRQQIVERIEALRK